MQLGGFKDRFPLTHCLGVMMNTDELSHFLLLSIQKKKSVVKHEIGLNRLLVYTRDRVTDCIVP